MPLSVAAQPAVICEQAWEVDYVDGWFYATNPAISLPIKMRPGPFMESIVASVECSRKHRPWERREQSAEIIDLAAHQAAIGKSSK